MHYYSFNIGDYTSHTAHLTPIEDIAYRRLLDLYYQTETQIQDNITAVCRQIRMRDHEDDVRQILSEFFTLCDGVWVSARCDREIEEYHIKGDIARSNGKKGGRPKKLNEPTNNPVGFSSFDLANPDLTQTKAKQEPRTNNQEPYLIKDKADKPLAPAKASRKPSAEKPGDVDQQVWDDFLTMRKAKGAPVTETALRKLASEAEKAAITVQQALETCCAQGWRGFKAEWVQGKVAATPRQMQPMKSFAEQDREHQMSRWEEMTGRIHPDRQKVMNGNVIDITPMQHGRLFLEN